MSDGAAPLEVRVVHVAGPMLELVQRCSRCRAILSDYRGAQSIESACPWTPKGWEGHVAVVETETARFTLATDDAPTCEELEESRGPAL